MILTVFDSEMKDKVFQNLQCPEDFNLTHFIDIKLKYFINKLITRKKILIVAQFGNESQTQSI